MWASQRLVHGAALVVAAAAQRGSRREKLGLILKKSGERLCEILGRPRDRSKV